MTNIPSDEDAIDLAHLRATPQALLLKYQMTIGIIVKGYISRGLFDAADFEDVIQSVNEAVLRRIPAMQRQFRGESTFKTYLSKIVMNICISLAKKTRHELEIRGLKEDDPYEMDQIGRASCRERV